MIAGSGEAIASIASHSRAATTVVEDLGDDLADVLLVAADGPRRELAEHQRALLLVLRVVQVDHGDVVALVDVRARSLRGREVLVVLLDRADVVVPRHHPQLLDRVPEDRRLVAQPAVRLPRVDVELRVQHIDRGRVTTELMRQTVFPVRN